MTRVLTAGRRRRPSATFAEQRRIVIQYHDIPADLSAMRSIATEDGELLPPYRASTSKASPVPRCWRIMRQHEGWPRAPAP